MQILHSARTPLFALALVATTMVCGVHASSTIDGVRAAEDSSVDQWSAMLWQAAIDGDRDRVDTLLMETPAISGMSYDAFRGQLRDWNDHQSDARDYVESRKLEIREELPASLDEDDLIEALRLAVEFQTLSEDYDTVLLDPMIIRTITDAKAKLPGVLESHDWLYAQEILLRLRTLYEDTAFTDTYDDYDRQMDANGRRMALLRRYAREELYELFIKRGERIGKPLTDPFNNALSNRWQQEVEHIDLEMVADALGTAQAEHVNNSGWDPLYDGGFDALEVLAATTALKATFPALGDPVQVQAWQEGLDRIEGEVDAQYETGRSPFRVNAWCFASLDQLNDETIDLPDTVLWREFGEGALESLDRYTSIIWPYDITEFNRQMEGKFIGVGIMITENEVGDIEVVQPLEGKPAYNAGLQPDDRIVEVDGQSTAGWSVQDAVHFITGPQHTTVTLGIEREGSDEVLYFPVDRDIIKMHSVKGWRKTARNESGEPVWDWYVDPDNRIGYVKLTQFSEDTYFDLRSAIEEMHEDGAPRGLVLDLRHNPGGLLTSAHQISDLFVSEGRIVSGEDKNGRMTFPMDAHRHNSFLVDLPTVVLINQGSASASEIVSGCIQAHEAGIVLGVRSFGKGSVQTVHNISPMAKLKCTTQYYRLPRGVTGEAGRLVDRELADSKFDGNDWGVIPDLEITMNPDQIDKSLKLWRKADLLPGDRGARPDAGSDAEVDPTDHMDVAALIDEGIDPQLELAVLLLQARALANAGDEIEQAQLPSD